ncbi:hypothetical protein [Chryseobacterium sp. Marseille-Q3244]|uniref:hypothetical protein n=1 Tax=Chryseobacterium sp. Marseille-Q3244 TaxID=2758092 RepID=UPI0020258B90|nr:hypothetical protein [Chryseobacterium sp. Marseille-Q3244]
MINKYLALILATFRESFSRNNKKLLSSKNYFYLPNRFRKQHDYCEFVINQIEELVLHERFIELKVQKFELSEDIIEKMKTSDEHIFDRLAYLGLNNELNLVVNNHLILSLIMETCYFIQESLLCSLKMRMTVCFTLLRKPFLEISTIMMRLLNEPDFIDKFNNLEDFDPIKITYQEKKRLLVETNKLLNNHFDNDDLYDFIFNKDFGDSLLNLTNNAIHLYTDRNPISATEKQNLNFIFSTEEDINHMWEYIYDNIPMLLSFLASSIDLLVSKSIDVDEAVFRGRLQQRQIMSKRYGIE